MGKLKNHLRHVFGLLKLYRRSRVLAFFVDHSREAHKLRLNPRESADEAHLIGTWNFDNPAEHAWQTHVLATLAGQTKEERWGDALEVGCSEGVFTVALAPRCHSVTAYEISPVAVARAVERCASYSNVRVLERDASQEIEGKYDLVFAMDVLWAVVGRSRRASIVSKLANAVHDGGLLVFSDSRMPKAVRHPLWSLLFPTGADEWATLLEGAPGLTAVHKEVYRYARSEQQVHKYWDKLFVLFRKQSASEA